MNKPTQLLLTDQRPEHVRNMDRIMRELRDVAKDYNIQMAPREFKCIDELIGKCKSGGMRRGELFVFGYGVRPSERKSDMTSYIVAKMRAEGHDIRIEEPRLFVDMKHNFDLTETLRSLELDVKGDDDAPSDAT